MNIIIDDREKKIIEIIDNYKIDYKIERINIGDIAICYYNKIIAIIERKTWNDLSSSIIDGRKENVNKLLLLRNKIDCKIFYFIEGNIDPKPNSRFNRIAYKNLRSHLDHLIFRDDIHIIHTKNTDCLINRIIELMNNYLTIKDIKHEKNNVNILKINNNDKNNDNDNDNDKNNDNDNNDNNNDNDNDNNDNNNNNKNNDNKNNNDNDNNNNNDKNNDNKNNNNDNVVNTKNQLEEKICNLNVDDDFLLFNMIDGGRIENNKKELKIKFNKNININKNILQSFNNINFILAEILDNEKYTFKSLYNTNEYNLLENILYNKKCIGNKSIKIIKEIQNISKDTKINKKLQIKILSCVPSISKKSAEYILTRVNFIDIINHKYNIDILSDIQKSEKNKIGKKASEIIINNLCII